jgi:hypothetical protein
MQEDCSTPEGVSDQVQVNIAPTPGQWIRRRGEDLTAGKTALTAGTFLRPQELGVAASAGDNADLLKPLKSEFTIYLHTPLESQLLHSGTKGVGRQGLLENREIEITARYLRRDPNYRKVASLVIEATRDRKKGATEIIEYLRDAQ